MSTGQYLSHTSGVIFQEHITGEKPLEKGKQTFQLLSLIHEHFMLTGILSSESQAKQGRAHVSFCCSPSSAGVRGGRWPWVGSALSLLL